MSEERLRLFLSIPPPPRLTARLTELQAQLQASTWDLRPTLPRNFHLTLHFLGETPARIVGDLDKELGAVAHARRPFDLSCGGLGAFPDFDDPRVVWVGLRGQGQALADLHQASLRVLNAYRLFKLREEFAPHLTLARVERLSKAWDARLLEGLKPQWEDLGRYPVEVLRLMRSVTKREGPEYSVLSEYPLDHP